MKSPSIAVMLGGKAEEAEGEGDLSLSEAKASAKDAASSFASAVSAGDADKIVTAFGALAELCAHVRELEESGETDDEEAEEEVAEEVEESEEE